VEAEGDIRDRNVTGVLTCALPILTTPIVGVPVFCIWDLGLSVRILWTNFNRLKNGIKIGLKRTVIKKLIAIVIMTTYRFIDFLLLSHRPTLLASIYQLFKLHHSRCLKQYDRITIKVFL